VYTDCSIQILAYQKTSAGRQIVTIHRPTTFAKDSVKIKEVEMIVFTRVFWMLLRM